MTLRPHTPADYPAIARLRWQLKSEDSGTIEGCGFARFAGDYARHLAERDAAGDTVHWLAEAGEGAGEVVGVMTLRIAAKEPSPDPAGARAGAIGYLTNCYVAPAHRNRGTGSALLAALAEDARARGLELLVVWPSERAYPFYRRAGFRGDADPLEWLLEAD